MIGNFFGAVGWLLNAVLNLWMLAIIVNALLSWLPRRPDNAAVRAIDTVADWICDPIRKLFPTVFGGFDLAPLIALLLLGFLQRWLVPTLAGL